MVGKDLHQLGSAVTAEAEDAYRDTHGGFSLQYRTRAIGSGSGKPRSVRLQIFQSRSQCYK